VTASARICSSVERAVAALHEGLMIALPTDTVYGLVVDPKRSGAAARLARAKGRHVEVPVQVLVSGMDQALALGEWSLSAIQGARVLWPGAATIVVPRLRGLALDLGGDSSTIGIRWPAHVLAARLCELFGPVAATSANIHGEAPLETAAEVARTFADEVAVVLDGGPCRDAASTVVDLTSGTPRILREGSMSEAAIRDAFGDC